LIVNIIDPVCLGDIDNLYFILNVRKLFDMFPGIHNQYLDILAVDTCILFKVCSKLK